MQHRGNINIDGKKDFVPQLAGMNVIRNKQDIIWKPVNKNYVHGFESYIEAHIVDISKGYFRENAVRIVGH